MPFVEPKSVAEEAAEVRKRIWPSYLADTRRQFPEWRNYLFVRGVAQRRVDAAMADWWEHSAPFWRDIYAMKDQIDAVR